MTDLLNRLKTVTKFTSAETETTQYAYDSSGNLTAKGSTSLSYLPTKPHLIEAAGANTYVHDANGNVELRNGPDVPGGIQFLHYTAFDLPQTIQTGPSATTAFDYSADEARLVRRDRDPANPSDDKTRIFVPGLYQRELDATGETVEERFHISAGGRPIAEIIRTPSGDETLYIHSDHLGSPDTLTSGTGATFTQAFDAFGAPDPDNAELTRSGFTGHEHDRDLGLIDMKGRVYDPLAAQFLSADPVMQAPHWSQGMNRYAYVFNDPVNATDPSGFISLPSAIVAVGVVGGHVASVGLIAYGFGLDVGLGLGGAGGVGAMNLAFTPSFSGTPGFSGTVHNAASVAPTAGGATQPGMVDALGQNRGIQEGATLGQGRTYRLAQCNTSGNPACGISRRFGSDPMDRVVEDFLNARSPDPAFTTVGDSILDLSAPEHAAPIIQDASGRMRLGTISASGTDQTQVRVNYPALPKGERYVGTIHSHPGASPGLSVGHSEDIDVPSMRELSARMGVRAFRSHVVAAGNGPFYAVHTFEVLPSPGKFILLAP